MTTTYSYDSYLSPFSWRYGSAYMRSIWSERHKRQLWRRVWVALAEAQQQAGLVSAAQTADLRAQMDNVDVDTALTAEKTLHHDLMAEIHVFASQAPIGAGIIHLGATSMDIEDNAEALRLRESLDAVIEQVRQLLTHFAAQIERWADVATMAFTHLQPAEPTTIGYRLAQYAQDLLIDLGELTRVRNAVRGKGIKGAVGTSASYAQLLHDTSMTPAELEALVMRSLDLPAFTVATQTYPRKQDYLIAAAVASLASSLYKFAFDLRLLQSPPIGEWSEGFAAGQVGSSAMPFKRNPINAEKVDSLARMIAHLVGVTWDNASHSLLERTLDDNANRREVLPTLFLATDEILTVVIKLISGLHIDQQAVTRTLNHYGTFAATEPLLMELTKAGADRQRMHALLREHSLAAWQAIANGLPNPLIESLCADDTICALLPPATVRVLMTASQHIGDAPSRARAIVAEINAALAVAPSLTS